MDEADKRKAQTLIIEKSRILPSKFACKHFQNIHIAINFEIKIDSNEMSQIYTQKTALNVQQLRED